MCTYYIHRGLRCIQLWLCYLLCLIRKQVNHRAGSNTFCTSTGSGVVLQKLTVKHDTSNLPDTQYLRRSQRIECIEFVSLSSRPFYCCASDTYTFSTTLHGLHTYGNFGLRLLIYLNTFEKGFPTHPMPNSWLIPFMHAV